MGERLSQRCRTCSNRSYGIGLEFEGTGSAGVVGTGSYGGGGGNGGNGCNGKTGGYGGGYVANNYGRGGSSVYGNSGYPIDDMPGICIIRYTLYS